MKHYVDDRGRIQLEDMPSKEYPLATVIDHQPLKLEDVITFLLECQPAAIVAFRILMVAVWMWLLSILLMGKF